MGTYNGAPYIEATVESILQQTYPNFEFVIIDDASTDATWSLLEQLGAQDARIVLHRNAANLGISATRNLGTKLAQGEFIAIMDHDDISLPNRLEKQVAYLDVHPEIGVVGGAIQFIIADALAAVETFPLTPGAVAWKMCFGVPCIHPASMVRRSVLVAVGGYDLSFRGANDYDLWVRLSQITGLANLPDIVLYYRLHSSSYSGQRSQEMGNELAAISQRVIEAEIGAHLTRDEVLHLITRYGHPDMWDRASKLSRVIYLLAHHVHQKKQLSTAEWVSIRHDAARRILRLLRLKADTGNMATALMYAARLDPVYTARWSQSMLRQAARRRLLGSRPQ